MLGYGTGVVVQLYFSDKRTVGTVSSGCRQNEPVNWDFLPSCAHFGVQLLVASLPAEAPLEHNFRYPRIRELTLDNDGIALGHRARTF